VGWVICAKNMPILYYYHTISGVLVATISLLFFTRTTLRERRKNNPIFLLLSKDPPNLKHRQGTNPTRQCHRYPNTNRVKNLIKVPSSQSTGNSSNSAQYEFIFLPRSPDFYSYYHSLFNHSFPSFRALGHLN